MHNQISRFPYQLINHHADKGSSPFHVEAKLRFQDNDLLVNFKTKSLDSQYNWQLGKNWSNLYYKNWRLWETDVVEFYLQLRQTPDDIQAPYYEFQVNPDNKQFVLKTIKPRSVNWTPMNLDFKTQNNIIGNLWSVEMKIDLSEHIFDSPKKPLIFGNFHACLGRENQRSYWSAFNIDHSVADFHRPYQFEELV